MHCFSRTNITTIDTQLETYWWRAGLNFIPNPGTYVKKPLTLMEREC